MAQTPSVRFSLLGGGPALGDDQLHDLYSYPGTGDCVVRGNAIASLDGAATTAGTSGGLGGPGDRRLFAVLREAADVIVVTVMGNGIGFRSVKPASPNDEQASRMPKSILDELNVGLGSWTIT